MSQIVLYIACSLDGFIARPDGNIDWLTVLPNPENTDHDYGAFLSTIGTTVMGRKTYDELLGFGIEWPYNGIQTYILTKNPDLKIVSPETDLLTGDVAGFISRLKENSEKDIWLIGGGQIITYFLNHDLVDKMMITFIPVILGEGIPLFPAKPVESCWTLVETKSFSTGAVTITYRRKQLDEDNGNKL